MKKYFLSLFSLMFASLLFGQAEQAGSPAPIGDSIVRDTPKSSLLWEISGKDVKSKSYLFGTIHMIPTEDYFIPEGMEDAIHRSDKIVFEIDMADMSDLGAQIGLFTKAFMANGTKLSDLLSPEDYKAVKDHFEAQGMPFFLFERIKPMFLASFMGEDMDPMGMSSGSLKSYEMEIYQLAQGEEIETGGLETIEYQLSIFDSIPYSDQAKMLVDALSADSEGDDQFGEMIELYKQQDIEALYAVINEDGSEMQTYGPLLIENRNRNWIPIMTALMKEGSVFFAVGAGHLGGTVGVIQLLRDQGYTLTPVVKGSIKPVKKI